MVSLPARLLNLRLLSRHQIAALVATLIDFATMIALVELARVPPPLATLIGAMCGGATNFSIARAWAFRNVQTGSLAGQAARYAVVSLGGAILNATVLALMLEVSAIPYVLARLVVSCSVSLVYSYPMHARVVFCARHLGADSQ